MRVGCIDQDMVERDPRVRATRLPARSRTSRSIIKTSQAIKAARSPDGPCTTTADAQLALLPLGLPGPIPPPMTIESSAVSTAGPPASVRRHCSIPWV